MKFLRRVLFSCLAIAATLLVAAVCAYLSAPLWIDSGAVKQEVARAVERASGHPVRIEQLRMRMFPPVGVEVANPRYRSENLAIEAGSAVVDVDFWPLLAGRVQPRLVRVSKPRIVVIPGPAPAGHATELRDVERQLRDGLASLSDKLPGLDFAIDDGEIEIRLPGRPPLVLRDLQASGRVSAAGAAATVECTSGFWQRALVDLSLARDSLAGGGHAEFVGLDAAQLLAWLGMDGEWSLEETTAIGRVDWRMSGLTQINAELTASASRISLRRGTTVQTFAGAAAAASAEVKGGAWSIRMDRLFLREPRLMLGGLLKYDGQSGYAFQVQGGDIDLAQVHAVARNLAPDAGWIARPPIALQAGTLAAMDLRSVAAEWPQLFDIAALEGELWLRDLDFLVRKRSLHFTGAGATLAFAQGTLNARNVTAVLGNSLLRDGQVDAELADDPKLLRATGTIDVDLAQALDLAGRFVSGKDVRARLAEVEKVEGRALARIDITEGRRGLQAAADLSDLALTVRHRRVPLPLRLTGGRLRYAAGSVALEQVSGDLGRSPFAGLDASILLEAPFRFVVRLREARLALEEAALVARQYPAVKPASSQVQGLTGNLSVLDAKAEGSLDALAATRFSLTTIPHGVKARIVRIETDLLLDGGEGRFTDRAVEFKDVGVETLDARLRVSASAGDYRDGIRAVKVIVNGEIGPTTLDRIQKEAALPPGLQVRPPLRLSDVHASWQRDGDFALQGGIRVANLVDLEVDASKAKDMLRISALRIRDRATDAVLKAERAGDSLNASFKGRISGETISALFAQPAFSLQEIEGDLAADLHLVKPWITRAQGRLAGRAIEVPLAAGPLRIERAILAAAGDGVAIEEAAFSIGDNRAEFKGTVHRVDEKLILDADLRADRIEIASLVGASSAPEERKPFALSDLPVAGRLGLDIGSLHAEQVTIAPLVADARVDGDLLDLRIERAALCDITMSGTLKGRLSDMRLEGSLASRKADVEKSIACLTSGRVVLSGLLDLDARFTASGPLGELARHLDGTYTAKAVDGRIEKFDTLNRVFSYLNLTEVLRGEKVQLGEKGLPYRTVDVKGTLEGERVHVDELVMDAPTVHIAAAGDIDYATGRLGMDVLVAPLQTANVLINKLPLVNRIFGGAVLALPVRVSGTVNTPVVVPLGPGSVARRMTSIIANTLRLPVDAVKTITPQSGSEAAGNAGR